MRTLFRTLLLTGAFLAIAPAVQAEDDLARIREAGEIRIGTEGTYAPFTFHDSDGLTGFDVEIGRAVGERLGVKARFVEGKWDGLIAGLDAGRYDAVMNQVSITEARQQKYDFSDPYIASAAVLIVRTDNDEIKSFDDLEGKRSANTLTSNFGKLAEKAGAQVVAVQGFNESVDLLLSRRVDATINDELSFLDFKKQKPDAPLHIVARDTSSEFSESGVLIRKGNPELRQAINAALQEMRADGTYKAISEKYFGVDLSAR